MIGARLQIDYFDHNEGFAKYLPRVGTVRQQFLDTNGSGPWLLLELDESFEYQLQDRGSENFRLPTFDAFLIRSRWQDVAIDGSKPVSVFILLLEQGNHPSGSIIELDNYVHVAWGMCKRVGEPGK